MNWFQRLLNNPNAHIIGAIATGAASIAFPAYAGALQIVSGVLGSAAVALPDVPKAPAAPVTPIAAPPVVLPAAAGGGAYHAVDYANLAAALLAEFAKPAPAARA